MIKVRDIARVIEDFAPLCLQESYDNAGLQVGDPDMEVSAVLLCLDVTEDILKEARERHCNMIVSHHPLIFKGLKHIAGSNPTECIIRDAIKYDIAIYSAHTNLDSTWNGVSHEMAHLLNVTNLHPLIPSDDGADTGLGVIGDIKPTPRMEFLRRVKESLGVKALRYSVQSPQLVVKRVALCGGSGASFIKDAVAQGADIIVTGDVKYHDFSTWCPYIIIADAGHYESEIAATKIFSRIIREKYPEAVIYFSESETNPVKCLI